MSGDKTLLAIIGGSRAYDLIASDSFGGLSKGEGSDTPFGKSVPIHLIRGDGFSCYFMSRHGEKGYDVSAPFVNYRANIWALKEKGVERIVSWSGPGSINSNMNPGDYVLPHDLIDQTKRRETTFFKNTGLGFIRMNEPFCPEISGSLAASIKGGASVLHERGIYCCTEGPRLETPAEIAMFASWNADLVGMTLVPEAFLAREMEICYAPLCIVTNYAEGVRERKFREGELFEGMQTGEDHAKVEAALGNMPAILNGALEKLSKAGRECDCRHAMARYRKSGRITDLLNDVSKNR